MATTGQPGTTTVTTPSDREVVITRVFAAPRHLVWKAWTDCAHLRRWMLGPEGWTMPICELDLRPGGIGRLVWRRGDGTEMEIRWTFREVSPPERIVHTESWGGGWPETLDTLVLTEQGGRTTARMTIRYPSKQARDAAIQTGMQEGMDHSFARLDDYLRTLA
jgi:uncharacterized protein YndB with AHSA1/START domain